MRHRQVSRPTWPQPQASLAPWSARQDRQRRDIVLVQGPAGSGKSLFAWSLYSRFGSVCLRADFGDVWWWWSMQRKIQIWALLWCLSLNRCRSSPDSYVMKICVAEVVRQALRYHFLFIFHGARPVRRLRPASLGLAQQVRHHLAARLPVRCELRGVSAAAHCSTTGGYL